MTQPSQSQPGGTPLFSDDALKELARNVPGIGNSTRYLVYERFAAIRQRYEQERAKQLATIAERDGKIAELERKLSNCSEYADKVRQQNIELAEQYYRLRAGLSDKDGNE